MKLPSSKLTVRMPPFVGEKRTPILESSVTDGIGISSIQEYPQLVASLGLWEKHFCCKDLTPGRLVTIVQGKFSMTLIGFDIKTL